VIAIVCIACKKGIAITPGEDGEVEALFFSEGRVARELACPSCQATALTHEDVSHLTADSYRELTAMEAHAAFSGLGFPGEADCGSSALEAALINKTIVGAVVRPIRGSHRCVLQQLQLSDGTSIFLSSSVQGAIVYRIARPESYVTEVLRGDV
jgi:hypothetical protein